MNFFLIFFVRFQSIPISEYQTLAWGKSHEWKCPNIVNLIRFSNRTTNWVASEIVSKFQFEQRVSLLKFFIEIAYIHLI